MCSMSVLYCGCYTKLSIMAMQVLRCLSINVDSIVSVQWLMNGYTTLTNEAIASGNADALFDNMVWVCIIIGVLDVINVPLRFK